MVKIYNGMTFDMKTSNVLEHGEVSYVEAKDITQMKGGGGSTTVTKSAFDAPEVKRAISSGQALFDQGRFGQVAGWDPTQLAAQNQGAAAAGRQTGLEQGLILGANTYNDGLETKAITDAQTALGVVNDRAGAYGNLDGSRTRLSQQGIANDLTGALAGLRSAGAQQNYNNLSGALGQQGTGARTLAGIGAGRQQHTQQVLDAPATGWQQFIGPLTGLSGKSTTSTQSGGGK